MSDGKALCQNDVRDLCAKTGIGIQASALSQDHYILQVKHIRVGEVKSSASLFLDALMRAGPHFIFTSWWLTNIQISFILSYCAPEE